MVRQLLSSLQEAMLCVVDHSSGERHEDARRDDLVRLLTTRFRQLEPRK
jgi:hypothetical protein